jgi:hypothetical protein
VRTNHNSKDSVTSQLNLQPQLKKDKQNGAFLLELVITPTDFLPLSELVKETLSSRIGEGNALTSAKPRNETAFLDPLFEGCTTSLRPHHLFCGEGLSEIFFFRGLRTSLNNLNDTFHFFVFRKTIDIKQGNQPRKVCSTQNTGASGRPQFIYCEQQ